MLLNCDLGEGSGSGELDADANVMPYIDQANVACGFHAGDPLTIGRTLALAAEHGVQVGAHPAYPDLEGFGRRSMTLTEDELAANMHYQMAALDGMAANYGLVMAHVKPHGALYHDMMRDVSVRSAILKAVASFHRPVPLIMQATSDMAAHSAEAESAGVSVSFEAFADRAYNDDGALLARGEPGALLNEEQVLTQVKQLLEKGSVISTNGVQLPLNADTICVHGDNPQGVAAIAAVRQLLRGN